MIAPFPIAVVGAAALGLGYAIINNVKAAKSAVHTNALTIAPSLKTDDPLVIKVPEKPIVPIQISPTLNGNILHVIDPINHDTGAPTTVFNVATNGKAVPQAHALYDYLVKNGPHSDGTAQLQTLTKSFQVVHNTDPDAVHLATEHKIPETGVYDLFTSGALSLYTGHPVPPNPATPPPAPMTAAQINDPKRTEPIQSPEAYSSFNLYSYLKLHGNDKSAALKALVKAFQHDVNTDPAFPGPASFSGLKLIKSKLTEDGIYGTGTYNALKISTIDTPKP